MLTIKNVSLSFSLKESLLEPDHGCFSWLLLFFLPGIPLISTSTPADDRQLNSTKISRESAIFYVDKYVCQSKIVAKRKWKLPDSKLTCLVGYFNIFSPHFLESFMYESISSLIMQCTEMYRKQSEDVLVT
jgi:hypothetical protein